MVLEIDREQIETPTPVLTQSAVDQLKLILDNDFTLEGKSARISISGKGCDGFDYALAFDFPHQDDFVVEVSGLTLLFDPFCAFYAQKLEIDFQLDPQTHQDGFVIKNILQKKFAGKFWKSEDERTPPTKEKA